MSSAKGNGAYDRIWGDDDSLAESMAAAIESQGQGKPSSKGRQDKAGGTKS